MDGRGCEMDGYKYTFGSIEGDFKRCVFLRVWNESSRSAESRRSKLSRVDSFISNLVVDGSVCEIAFRFAALARSLPGSSDL